MAHALCDISVHTALYTNRITVYIVYKIIKQNIGTFLYRVKSHNIITLRPPAYTPPIG